MNCKKILILFLIFLCGACAKESNKEEILSEAAFVNPPHWAKPRTWMHVMSGNMTKEGMTKDLESIKDVGIGGILLFDVAQGIPYGPIEYNSAEHHELLKHTASECERLGLSFGFHNCAGWSASGGPWIKPEESMKMLVYSQQVIDGGNVNLTLLQPTKRENFYRDIAVLAYPALETEICDASLTPVISSSDKNLNCNIISDNRIDECTTLEKVKSEEAFVLFDYEIETAISSVYVVTRTSTMKPLKKAALWVSDNGKDYTKILDLNKIRTGKFEWCFLDSFKPVSGRYFKIMFEGSVDLKEIKLSATALTDDFLNKNCMGRKDGGSLEYTRIISDKMVINKKSVVDLTSSLSESGVLKTKLPKGKWTILRFGYTSTGAFNHPASDSGRGLECDKFSKKAVLTHFTSFSQKVIDNVKNIAPNALQYIEIDSYEMGGQNWTDNFESIFKNKKGYDIIPFLPLLVGKYMDDIRTIENVMSDFRDVCCDLMKENYFEYFVKLCHDNGLQCYVEPYGFGPFNGLEVGGVCDIPMGEFWMNRPVSIVRSSVSSAHIYGKNVVSAESFTSQAPINWKGHPAMAKPSGDRMWKEGVNEFMFHRFAHQANTHVRPGMTMNRFGFHFDRTQTWWNNAGKDWFKYMARGSYLLRLGVPVVDVLEFVGDNSPTSVTEGDYYGFKSDAVNSDVLINRIKVENGRMILPEGNSYRILSLQNTKTMKIETLRRICELAEEGVPVIGELPEKISGYVESVTSNNQMHELIRRIKNCTNYYEAESFFELIEREGIEHDFYLCNPQNVKMGFAHRRMSDGSEIYFISNPEDISHRFVCDFRVSGKIPELWKPMDGSINDADIYKMNDKKHTSVTIDLDAYESVFVIFRKNTTVRESNVIYKTDSLGQYNLNNDWKVSFNDSVNKFLADFKRLDDWRFSADDNIRYYSGTAVYKRKIEVDDAILKKSNQAILDLGDVYICAEVFVNGKRVAIKWMYPFKIDIYPYLQDGENHLEIHITNQWTNRLIGDERYQKQDGGYKLDAFFPEHNMPDWYVLNKPMPSGPRITFCTGQFYKDGDSLLPAGMVGPVNLFFISKTK